MAWVMLDRVTSTPSQSYTVASAQMPYLVARVVSCTYLRDDHLAGLEAARRQRRGDLQQLVLAQRREPADTWTSLVWAAAGGARHTSSGLCPPRGPAAQVSRVATRVARARPLELLYLKIVGDVVTRVRRPVACGSPWAWLTRDTRTGWHDRIEGWKGLLL